MEPLTSLSPTSRRGFLRQTGLGLAALTLRPLVPPLLAGAMNPSFRARTPRALVLIHLEGGHDDLSTFVPLGDERYRRLRPKLALPRSRVIPLTPTLALNRAGAALEPLFKDGKLALVQNLACAQPSLSHYRAAEIWHTGSGSDERLYSGWAAGALTALSAEGRPVSAYHAGTMRPRVFQDGPQCIETGNTGARSGGIASSSRALNSRDPLSALGEISRKAGDTGGDEIYFITVPGFDTHAMQAEIHDARLWTFSEALAAFQRQLARRGVEDRVLTLAFTEFGRSAEENAQGGTDHGVSSSALLLGGGIRGGVYHRPRGFADASEPMEAPMDFRRIVRVAACDWLGAPASRVFARDPGDVAGLHVPRFS